MSRVATVAPLTSKACAARPPWEKLSENTVSARRDPTHLHDASSAIGRDDRDRIFRLAEATTPAGGVLGPPDERLVTDVVALLHGTGGGALAAYRAVLRAPDVAAVPLAGSRLCRLGVDARLRVLTRLADA
jgi:hypothetical protein